MADRACPASRTQRSPSEEESRGSSALGATMKGPGQPKTRLPPTRSFVPAHCRCRCCCCWCVRCRRYHNAQCTPAATDKASDLSCGPTRDRHNGERDPRSTCAVHHRVHRVLLLSLALYFFFWHLLLKIPPFCRTYCVC